MSAGTDAKSGIGALPRANPGFLHNASGSPPGRGQRFTRSGFGWLPTPGTSPAVSPSGSRCRSGCGCSKRKCIGKQSSSPAPWSAGTRQCGRFFLLYRCPEALRSCIVKAMKERRASGQRCDREEFYKAWNEYSLRLLTNLFLCIIMISTQCPKINKQYCHRQTVEERRGRYTNGG